jgi:hypothetical protein
MKIEKLFKMAEKFFDMGKKKQKKNGEKKAKLESALDEKIVSMKAKIKNSDSKKKKEKLKVELTVLEEIRKKCD